MRVEYSEYIFIIIIFASKHVFGVLTGILIKYVLVQK